MADLKKSGNTGGVTREVRAEDQPAVGRWYWWSGTEDTWDGKKKGTRAFRVLGCVTHIGSNYVKIKGPSTNSNYDEAYWSQRLTFAEFTEQCEAEPDHRAVLAREIAKGRATIDGLLVEAQDVMARIGLSGHVLSEGTGQALAVLGDTDAPAEYKKALVKAKDKELPELFKQIEAATKAMATWMKADLIPLKAEVAAAERQMQGIQQRIFVVELYAGLSEHVEQVADGAPAAIGEQVRVFQRRAYMDEECLADYRAGGMEFKDIGEFDRWIAEPAHRDRLLPFPRCVLAFQVRRHEKERHFPNWRRWVSFALSREADRDKFTYLYIRNGERLYRMSTAIEFGDKLFPDITQDKFGGVLYAKRKFAYEDKFDGLITEGHYLDLVRAEAEALKKHKEAVRRRKAAGESGGPWDWDPRKESENYVKWDTDSIYYDDIHAYVKAEMAKHNRLVVVLQGLLDRSPVFHPHPPSWKLWTPHGFTAALDLVYDDSRALVATDLPPDFAAYQRRVNAGIGKGSTVTGQHKAWLRAEAKKYNESSRRGRRGENHYDVEEYKPYGNPGPGLVATVAQGNARRCLFQWMRTSQTSERRWGGRQYGDPVPCRLWVPTTELLDVKAYQPGDFRQFFADPRTRADYLQWAPLLLTAEDWHAGRVDKKGGDDE